MGSARISKLPAASEMAVCTRPVSRFVTVTEAPGSAALDESTTVPRIEPCVPTCPMSGTVEHQHQHGTYDQMPDHRHVSS